MRREIPAPVLAVCAEVAATLETHATLDSLFAYAEVSGDAPGGSKPAKALEWLRRTNRDQEIDPLKVLGRIIEAYMDRPLDPTCSWNEEFINARERITRVLAECDLQYQRGGRISNALGVPTRTLESFIRYRDLAAIDREFERATSNVETHPREAVSAASNVLESVCKVYIEDERLNTPAKQDLQSIWGVVRKHLGFDPSKIEDTDLKKILSGMISVVDGIGSLRTHASSAHGSGRKAYRLEPRHARLAIHSAHTIALFILESWHRSKDEAQ